MHKLAELERYFRATSERRAKEAKDIRKSIQGSGVPLSDDLLSRILPLSTTSHAKHVLQEHRGFALSERRENYRASLSRTYLALDDLDEALVDFERLATSDEAEITLPKNSERLAATERRIQKELFASLSMAASLQDHVRRLRCEFKLLGFGEHLESSFGNDGLHEWVIQLRNLLHHEHIVKAKWLLRHEFTTGERCAEFRIDGAELVRRIEAGGHATAKKVESIRHHVGSSDGINLLKLFREYRKRLKRFYDWLNTKIDNYPPAKLQDYDRCILEIDRHADRTYWNVLLTSWLNSEHVPDVHNHLPNHLNEEQLDAVYRLPRNSIEQADLIIEFFDEHEAADDKLRGSVHQLFRRLSQQEELA